MTSPEKKIRPLFFIIAFLFITNMGLVLFLLFSRGKPGTLVKRDQRTMVQSFLEDSVYFNKEQMSAYFTLRKKDFEKRRPIIDSMKSARNRFYENIYTEPVGDSVINMQADAFGATQILVDKHMLQYFRNVRSICTPAQLHKFDSSFKIVVEKVTSGRNRNPGKH